MQPDESFDEARFRPTEADALPAADLTELFAQASTSPAYQAEFYRRLLTDMLYIVVESSPDEEKTNSSGEMPIRPLFTSEGALPVFTNQAAVFAGGQLQPETTTWVQLNGRELLSKIKAEELLINPFSVPSLSLSPEAVEQILTGSFLEAGLGGQMEALADSGSETLYPVPATHEAVAGQLSEQLTQLFGQHPRVRRAALAWQPAQGDGPNESPIFVLFIDVEGSGERLAQEVVFVARHLLQEAQVNLKILFDSSDDNYAVLQEQLEVVPFYQD